MNDQKNLLLAIVASLLILLIFQYFFPNKPEVKTQINNDVIELLINEVKQSNEEGNNFSIAESIVKQLPFFACLNTSSMEWSVPTVVSHDMPRAPKVGHIKQALQAKIPYRMYGHSMTKVNGWNNNGGDNEVDVYLFGGWEWYSDNEFGENLSGPILSDRLTLMRVRDDQTTTVASWTEIKPKSMHRSPGPRSNHTAISHTVGLFIFGGRRLKNGETTPGAPGGNDNNKNSLGRKKKKKKGNNNPHQKMLIVDLE